MTGIFVRVKRDGHWTNAEFDQLTDAALQAFVAGKLQAAGPIEAAEEAWGWAMALARWIRDHVQDADA